MVGMAMGMAVRLAPGMAMRVGVVASRALTSVRVRVGVGVIVAPVGRSSGTW
jgi:hypothetical protein